MQLNWRYYRSLFPRLVKDDPGEILDQLAIRLEDNEIAMTILRSKGYEGLSLVEMVKRVPPASLKYS